MVTTTSSNGHISTSVQNGYSHIEVTGDRILIHNLEIPGKDTADYLKRVSIAERDRTFINAFEVGVFCLERTQNSQDTEFVRRQIESMLAEVNQAIVVVPEKVQQQLIDKLGTADGQVLHPIQTLIDQVSGVTKLRLDEVKNLLSQDIDPAKESSILGNALKHLKSLLDPSRNDSIQGVLTASLKDVTAENGSLAKVVKSVVLESVKPLADEIERLNKEISAKKAVEEALLNTTAKGTIYEEEIVAELQGWAKLNGAEVHYIGTDNQPGDIIINLTSTSVAGTELSIVIEARDRDSKALGRKPISTHLSKAMSHRQANAAIYLSRSREGLAKEIGEWSEGVSEQGFWIATTHNFLTLAIRFLIVQQRLTIQRTSQPEIDAIALEDQLQRIRTTLKRITNINKHLKEIRESANVIETEADNLKQEIRSAIDSIEDTIRTAKV